MESLVDQLKNYKFFSQVVSFDPATDKLFPFDFTASNTELTVEIFNDLNRFSDYINTKLKKANARYGIGGYGEHRTIYSRSRLFDGSASAEEPRRLHLGIDIWGEANTVVMAPLDGEVHSFANNNTAGDYGATIILNSIHYTDI
jgi:peptidoglycan LD-endopeptidase LytH